MRTEVIITRLEEPTKDHHHLVRRLIAHEKGSHVIAALALHPPSARIRDILCYILGSKHDRQAVPALLTALQDSDERVRSSAADALAKIKDPAAGQPLFEQYERESPDSTVRSIILAALGAVHYTPAISTLISALEDPDGAVRLCAAWSLGALHAHEAQDALEHALVKELAGEYSDASTVVNMREALRQLAASRQPANG